MLRAIINKSNISTFLLILTSLIGTISLQQKSLKTIAKANENVQQHLQQEKIEKANLELIARMPSFGFDNLIADWTVFKFLQYFGNKEARKSTDYSLSPKYFRILVDRDPNFTRAYFRLAPAVTLKAARPQETVSILEEGLSQISPERYRANYLWVYKAIDELLFLGDTQAAIKSFETAAEWSSMINDTPREESARRTAQFLANDPNNKTVQVGAWFTVWTGAPDIETRNLAQQNIERLGGRLEIRDDGRVFAHPPQEEKG